MIAGRRSLWRLGAALGVALLAGSALLACSEPTDQEQRAAYCEAVSDAAQELTRIADEGGAGAFVQALPTLEGLAEAAPADLEDEWATYLDALHGLRDAVADAGLEPSALDAPLSEDVAQADRQAIATAVATVTSAEVRAAATGITQQALDVCDTQIL
ncbi:hypothetical protein NODU109028_05385 [Nocardioides dubius]|uniref:Uncharacterized protein n=1 Tax=Nocardioides dubius TaxID=317019 RepID=A0ABN1TQ51_9ACTN